MSEERRNFNRRKSDTLVSVATLEGQDLDPRARVVNLSVGGIRIATSVNLMEQSRYRAKLAKTDIWFEISVQERRGEEYRCKIESSWEDLQDVIRQSDDLTLLILEASDPQADDP